ncbi:MAG: glycerate kinase [Candidatus Hodarchaeota archaeon]
MELKNYNKLISISADKSQIKARKILIDLYKVAVESVCPQNIIQNHLKYKIKDKILIIDNDQYSVESRKIWIIGAGKAVGGMAKTLEMIFIDLDYSGIICIPEGIKELLNLKKIHCLESSHPLPSDRNIKNTKQILEFIKNIKSKDLVITLLSGGGSSMWITPISPITINDMVILNQLLLKSGMSIHEINVVRKHVSEIKGGKLASKIPGEVILLVLSDVIGDKLESIASGPLVPDPSTFNEAKAILQRFKLWRNSIPDSVRTVIQSGIENKIAETLKTDDPIFKKTHSYIIGSNRIACKAAMSHASKIGLNTLLLTDKVEGEAKWVGKLFARIYSGLAEEEKEPLLIVSGGEPIVEVLGNGIGGRNQEVAAAALIEFLSYDCIINFAFLSAGTDGIDGNSLYAGALIDNVTISLYRKNSINIENYRSKSDLCSFFEKIGSTLLETGPTGTNVMDIHLSLIHTNKLE